MKTFLAMRLLRFVPQDTTCTPYLARKVAYPHRYRRSFRNRAKSRSRKFHGYLNMVAAPRQGGVGKLKNSHIGGAVFAAPGRDWTPRPSSIRRNVLSC